MMINFCDKFPHEVEKSYLVEGEAAVGRVPQEFNALLSKGLGLLHFVLVKSETRNESVNQVFIHLSRLHIGSSFEFGGLLEWLFLV